MLQQHLQTVPTSVEQSKSFQSADVLLKGIQYLPDLGFSLLKCVYFGGVYLDTHYWLRPLSDQVYCVFRNVMITILNGGCLCSFSLQTSYICRLIINQLILLVCALRISLGTHEINRGVTHLQTPSDCVFMGSWVHLEWKINQL